MIINDVIIDRKISNLNMNGLSIDRQINIMEMTNV